MHARQRFRHGGRGDRHQVPVLAWTARCLRHRRGITASVFGRMPLASRPPLVTTFRVLHPSKRSDASADTFVPCRTQCPNTAKLRGYGLVLEVELCIKSLRIAPPDPPQRPKAARARWSVHRDPELHRYHLAIINRARRAPENAAIRFLLGRAAHPGVRSLRAWQALGPRSGRRRWCGIPGLGSRLGITRLSAHTRTALAQPPTTIATSMYNGLVAYDKAARMAVQIQARVTQANRVLP